MTEKRVTVDGLSLAYVEEGTGMPVLYLHGNWGSKRWFERVMTVPGCKTVAPDLPNFGDSDPMGEVIDLDRYADVVAHFSDALGLHRPVIVGHSQGGGVAISIAARMPDRCRGLVLVDSVAISGLPVPPESYPVIESRRRHREELQQALKYMVPALKDDAFFELLVDDGWRMAAPAWIGHAKALTAFDYRGKCGAFHGPVLVLRGVKDILITKEGAEATAKAFSAGRHEELEGVGHSVVVEDPSRFLGILGDFLASLPKDDQAIRSR
jgi:branched-chain amino acid transport system permease protein